MSITASDFTTGQVTFSEVLASISGLDAGVIAAWVYQEMNGTAASQRQVQGNNDWLNIGYTGSGTYGATDKIWSNPTSAAHATYQWMQGSNTAVRGYPGAPVGIQAILEVPGRSVSGQIAAIQQSGWASSGEPDLPGIYASLTASFLQTLRQGAAMGGNAAGGVAGLGGTGTTANPSSPWTTVGDVSNPDQDYYTTINQYCQDAQWYAFSDGETFYVADGIMLMAQTPAAIIDRLDPRVIALECTWDNTSWDYAVTKSDPKAGIQRRATLERTTSPTEVTLSYICDIDDFRAGDTVRLTGCGPANGPWLISDCTRSIFQPFSQMTLNQGAMPLSAASGETIAQTALTGLAASKPGSGTVMAAMLAAVNRITNRHYPYIWGGGHGLAGYASIGEPGGPPGSYNGHTIGFDCSGFVAAVLAFAGQYFQLGSATPPVLNENGIISALLAGGYALPGQGSGSPECTIFVIPGQHIYMRLNGHYAAAQQPGIPVGWYDDGSPLPGSVAYHIPAKTLGTLTNASTTGA